MKNWLVAIVCVATALAIASSASGKGGKRAAKGEEFKGALTAVDAESITLATEDSGAVKKFTLNADTQVRIETAELEDGAGGKKPAHKSVDGTVADLKVGEHVVVTSADKTTAGEVLIVFAKGKGKKGGEEAKPQPAPETPAPPTPAPPTPAPATPAPETH